MRLRIAPSETTPPVKLGDYFYFEQYVPNREHALYVRKGTAPEAPEEILLDPNIYNEGYPGLSVESVAYSPDQRYFAYAIDFEGDLKTSIFVNDLKTGEAVESARREGISSIVWLNSEVLLYLTADETGRPNKVWAMSVSADEEGDTFVLTEDDPLFMLDLERTEDKQFALISSESRDSSKCYFVNAEDNNCKAHLLLEPIPGVQIAVSHQDGDFVVLTQEYGQNGAVCRLNPVTGDRCVILNCDSSVVRDDLFVTANYIAVQELVNGLVQIRILDAEDQVQKVVTFDEPSYAAQLQSNFDFASDRLWLHYSSFVTPQMVYELDLKSGTLVILRKPELASPIDNSQYVVERIFAEAADGTLVPISLFYRSDIRLPAPCLVMGYGAYGEMYEAEYSAHRFPLVDRGFIVAIAHVRGGGEGGKGWHDGGRLLNKWNSFKDFIACLEELIKKGLADKERIAVYGGSAGGLLVGTVINERPDLINSAVLDVPFVDVINTMSDPTLPMVEADKIENGDVDNGEHYRYMLSYSPYENLGKQGGEIPSVLVLLGWNDENVQPHEGLKYAQRLRAVRDRGDLNPTYVRCEMATGHAGPTGRYAGLGDLGHSARLCYFGTGWLGSYN